MSDDLDRDLKARFDRELAQVRAPATWSLAKRPSSALRVAVTVAVVAALLVGATAGGLALREARESAALRSPSTSAAPSPSPTASDGAFVPPTSVVDDQRVVTLRFPGGITGEIAYPADVDVHARGATPGGRLSIAGDHQDVDPYGRPIVSAKIEAHRGARDDVLREINDGQPPKVIAEYPGARGETVALYATSAGNYLAWQAGSWTLLVSDPTGSGTILGAEPRDQEEDRTIYAANLHLHEDPDGWLGVTADPPLRVDAPYVVLGDPGAALAFARGPDRLGPELSAGHHVVVVYAWGCVGSGRTEAPSYVSWCDRATQLSFDVVGSDAFVKSLAEGLQARASEYPPSVIDPGWVSEDAKEAWQAEHGEGTWIAGYFYEPFNQNAMPQDLAELLTLRWKRISDDDLRLGREEGLRAALTALTGPPPPQLSHAWQGRALELRSAEMDGSELMLDFAVLRAGALGSHGSGLMGEQFYAVAFHYYPEADSICVLLDGEPSEWLHDAFTCPSRQLP
ncbi:MAG: hypothetical protein ACRDGE_05840 [Candidatus Limnocylindria bacterium]